MELAVNTGVSFRDWLRDPAAMVTAVEILERIGAELEQKRR